ncbi:thioredoxin-like negative regulator of GroEL [Trueperella bonasi]|uniref:Thioredoxin-like negative regulator of GroEL n=1 Tax=Trueperella bonasi TaxID=312286 RepID=A0ABT9NI56_9ACTO|nr:hypothetical protein [Trueperella bonasi]MDP9807067.1 thioredoxin-like negative regulator of GroEL [Trueperella bonasi]
MAFIELMRQLFDASHHGEDTPHIQRAVQLRDTLSDDPNDIAAFEELASIIKNAETDRNPADPLTGERVTPDTDEPATDPELVLYALAEEIGSDSRAWYPLVQLARLSGTNDAESARRFLETAADRDETGLALAEGVKLLRETGQHEAAIQLGLGRWQPETQIVAVGEELANAALEAKKIDEARGYVEILKEAGAPEDVIDDLSLAIATTDEAN